MSDHKRILVTGGAGFIGSHLCGRLIHAGNRVTVIDNLSTGRLENIRELMEHPRFQFFRNDIMNEGLMDHLVRECDEIYHLAAIVGVKNIVDDPVRTLRTIIVGTDIVLQLAHRHDKKKVLLTSTSEVYGKSPNTPFSEEDDRVLGPTTRSRWSYSSAKAVDEYMGLAYHKTQGLPVIIGRLFNTVGPKQTGQYGMVLPRFVRQALAGEPITVYGDGSQTRTLCYVDDVIDAITALMQHRESPGGIFNIGTEEEITIMNLAERVKSILKSSSEIVVIPYEKAYEEGFEDMMRRAPDIAKIRRTIGWTPKYRLDEIIRKVAEWAASVSGE
ncbi:MAG TPA: NAD-dependent epimerase/dehydratase family protein [Candidatus Aminicenantes bacterium]|nr:NAD-dependent epimerase/dehydratase family protein [Candidatus Aminicenantes bacterium]